MALSYKASARRGAQQVVRTGQWACLGPGDAAFILPSLPCYTHLLSWVVLAVPVLFIFFLSIKTFFHCQKSKLSCPVRQTPGDFLAVETVLNVAKDSYLYFSDVGEEKVCRMLLCRPQCGCLKRFFWAFLASLAKLVLLEVTLRIKLQYKWEKSNKSWSISKQPVGHAKITQEVETTKRKGRKKNPRRAIIRIFAQV